MSQRCAVLFMQSQEFFGADSQIHASIMRHLDRDRFEVHCATPAPIRGREAPSAVALQRIPDLRLRPTRFGPTLERSSRLSLFVDGLRSGIPAVVSMVGLVRYARRNDVAIVHCTEKPRDVLSGMVVAKLSGAACVIHVHVKAESWIRSVVRRLMHRAAALIGVSEFVAQSIRDLGYDSAKVHAVLNGLELDEWIGPEDNSDFIRHEFAMTTSTPLIVSASRLYRYKGQHELLAALPAVKEDFPDVCVLIVGEDDPRAFHDEASYTAELVKMRSALDLEENVIFTGFRSDVRDIMAASDIYAMPSHEEPFGMVFIEAMSLGKPVVALNNGGTKEVVDHGGSGLLSERDDSVELAANILTLLHDADLRDRMGRHGRQRVIELLNSERMARETAGVYEAILPEIAGHHA